MKFISKSLEKKMMSLYGYDPLWIIGRKAHNVWSFDRVRDRDIVWVSMSAPYPFQVITTIVKGGHSQVDMTDFNTIHRGGVEAPKDCELRFDVISKSLLNRVDRYVWTLLGVA